jgi:tetratricopeptide (TPR) repeat protein
MKRPGTFGVIIDQCFGAGAASTMDIDMRNLKANRRVLSFNIRFLLLLLLVPLGASAQGNLACGSLTNNYGPYDYTNPVHFTQKLPVVEQYHYDAGVQALKGMLNADDSVHRVGGDIEYTLRAFPNHHQALYTMIRYYLESVPRGAQRMSFDPACWFERARRFVPEDATVLMLEGIYFQKVDDLARARRSYEQALSMNPNSAELNYNAALLFIDLKEYERASEHAERAYSLGHPLPGLRRRLVRLGVWESEKGTG